MRPILIAPDSFKGTFSAIAVARALERGLVRAGVTVDTCPVADGGEGTIAVLLGALSGRLVSVAGVNDPLGRPITARFARLGSGSHALVEAAAASGLGLVAIDERDPWAATTYGTGQLICAAAGAGASTVLVAVGGSATVDGGAGALAAIADAGGLGGARIVVLCDVVTTWERCAEVYGPQKGADADMVARLAVRLDELAATLPRDPRGVAGGGAAGGLAGGLWAGCDAVLQPGAPWVLDALGFDARLQRAGAVVCGEGRLDAQSGAGKIVSAICARAHARAVPVFAVVGRDELDASTAGDLGLRAVLEATTLDEIEAAGVELGRLVRAD